MRRSVCCTFAPRFARGSRPTATWSRSPGATPASARHQGADSVKFQMFQADRLVAAGAPKAPYQLETTATDESQHEMLARLELGADAHRRLAERASQRGLLFLSAPFDEESLRALV